MRRKLVLATTNKGKAREYAALLSGIDCEVVTIDTLVQMPEIVEDGETFRDNAVIKAKAVARACKEWSLADDSGLEVDCLRGAPGVRSARFAGEHATDGENIAALLDAIARLPASEKQDPLKARFRCAIAVLDGRTLDRGAHEERVEPLIFEGTCEGAITLTPRGSSGFGYDPVFVPHGSTRTMAELTADEKNELSHRARALLAAKPVIEKRLVNRQ